MNSVQRHQLIQFNHKQIPHTYHNALPLIQYVNGKKGIKRDQDKFPTLKRDAGWKVWNNLFVTQANAQDVGNVLDPTYQPSNPTERALFAEQQKFMLAVFADKLQTVKGKSLVQTYASTANAQKIYEELKRYPLKSTQAEHDAERLLNYLLTSQANDGNWKEKMHSYILDWFDKAIEYNEKSNVKIDDDHLRLYLEHAVAPVPELAIVKTTA